MEWNKKYSICLKIPWRHKMEISSSSFYLSTCVNVFSITGYVPQLIQYWYGMKNSININNAFQLSPSDIFIYLIVYIFVDYTAGEVKGSLREWENDMQQTLARGRNQASAKDPDWKY